MTRLTEKGYWEDLYRPAVSPEPVSAKSRLKALLRRLMGRRLLDLIAPYDDYLLWRVVLPDYLPASCAGLSVIEIGSAPGDFLVRFAATFHAEPYGVEYTAHGAERNRRNFSANGLAPANVIEADFFSDDFLEANKERFDIVVSRGFIEHFDDPGAVVARHVSLLRPGGLLLVMIPNLRGIYYWWTRAFNPEQLPLHNLDIMTAASFGKLFGDLPLERSRCGYFGTFSFWLFTAPIEARWVNRAIRLLLMAQRGLNFAFRLILRSKGFESGLFSPNLIYVGRKAKRQPQ